MASAGPPTWTYTLTFDPEDNYSIFQANTTITMSGLYGVTTAGAPTSTDFPSGGDLQLQWTPQVLNGGTTVVWTHVGPGTGNWNQTLHVFGFTITAPSAATGTVSFATSGMSLDSGSQSSVTVSRGTGNAQRNVSVNGVPTSNFNRDISGTIPGPASAGGSRVLGAPALSPFALVLTALGLALAGGYQARARLMGRLGIGS